MSEIDEAQMAADFASIPDRVDGPMRRARALVEAHITEYGMVPHPDKIKEAIAVELGLAEIRGIDRMKSNAALSRSEAPVETISGEVKSLRQELEQQRYENLKLYDDAKKRALELVSSGDLFNALVSRVDFDGSDPLSLSLGELRDAIAGAKLPPSQPDTAVREALAESFAKKFPAVLAQYSQFKIVDWFLAALSPQPGAVETPRARSSADTERVDFNEIWRLLDIAQAAGRKMRLQEQANDLRLPHEVRMFAVELAKGNANIGGSYWDAKQAVKLLATSLPTAIRW